MSTSEANEKTCTSFAGVKMIATGDLKYVAQATKEALDGGERDFVLIFDDATAQPIEIDFRGTAKDVLSRLGETARRSASESKSDERTKGPGRPKLGVVAREITLLPRHWDWLNSQPGGASVALRKLVDEARRANVDKDTIRRSQEAAYRFMSAMAGNLPGFEESTRALFAGNETKFNELTEKWPVDIRRYSQKLASAALRQGSETL